MTEYPDYFVEAGTHILSAEEKADPMKFFHICDHDIVCKGLRVAMVLSYMAATKKKAVHGEGQKVYSYINMRKINDAVLFGAITVKQILSSSYYYEMDSSLSSFKKETADARSHGNVLDEKCADPISFSLFCLILTWAIERGNILCGCGPFCNGTSWQDPYQSTLWLYTVFPYLKIIL